MKVQSVNVTQNGSKLTISFQQTSNTTSISKLYVKNEFHSITYPKNGDDLEFEIDLDEVIQVFKQYDRDKAFVVVEENQEILTTQKNLKVFNNFSNVHKLHRYSDGVNSIYPYISKNGFLHLSFTDNIPTKTYLLRRHIDDLMINNSSLSISGKFSLINSTMETANIVITTRLSNHEKRIPFKTDRISGNTKTEVHEFSVDIYNEFIEFMQYPFDLEDIIDIYIDIHIQELKESIKVKLGNPRIMVERFLKGEIISHFENEIISATPYFTMKGRNLSFRVNRYSIESYLSYLKSIKSFKSKSEQKVWVIGEKSYKAQDNGYHFFKYLRKHHPEIPAYYIIERESQEVRNVLPLGNVIYYRSPEHFKIMLEADYICSTHHPHLLYPTNSKIYTKKISATKIFLQHGVLGTKNLTEINGNHLIDFDVDLFVTSSEREKEIVVRDLNFNDSQVLVSGLPRFDELFNPNVTVKKQILIIPTWRDWLTNLESVENSEYRIRMEQLLHSPKLKTLHSKGFSIIFCLHPNMQPFLKLFDVPKYITSIKQGDVDVQRLIQESQLMITDYSSVAFDFSFLNKPVIYYQYDTNQFLGNQPSHIDIESELPGVIVNNINHLENEIQNTVDNNFIVNKEIKARAKTFYSFNDQNNSKRVYNLILNARQTGTIKSKIIFDPLTQHLTKRFRKNKYYFNIMSKFNSLIAKVMPVDKKMVVFESNIGKSVSDSPKVIYDCLKEKSHDYQIVWVNNKSFPFNDPNVKSVKRLSPAYFYYLSRAKFWINNQNFPYYLTKPNQTTYIQTWHGTPLKKMLNDVPIFEGRDEGYKDRVNTSIQSWDYLISPSPYATKHFKSAFNFKKDILEIGYPRNDLFYNQDENFIAQKTKKIKQKLGIASDKKIILYAPTFRDDEVSKSKKHIINLKMDLNKMKDQLGQEYILLLRPHIIISNAIYIEEHLKDFVVNVADYNEISDLYLITDICITDYSSIMFDFANTRKPLLFFTYDYEHYKEHLRGFYFDFKEMSPGPLLYKDNELINAIKNIDNINRTYANKYSAFYNEFCTFENGTSAQTIINRFFNVK